MMLRPAGFVSGILVFIGIQVLPVPEAFLETAHALVAGQSAAVDPLVLAESMQRVLAVTGLMVVWWLTEAVPLAATALLPALLFPVLQITGLQSGRPLPLDLARVLPSYASPVIFLFLGGFLLAGAMQKWGLDRRFTLWLLTRGRIAEDSRAVLLGIMTVTALLSMWISNTATAAMMLPLGIGILRLMNAEPGRSTYARALMLGIAWAASIGGVGTIIGSPPNGIAVGILDQTFREQPEFGRITFLDWMKFGVPLVVLLLLVVVLVLFVELLTEITSNTAVTSMVVPVVISIGLSTGANPVTLALAAALAASMAFMLPVATPPNALVFGSGYVRMSDMIRAGVVLELCAWVTVVGVLYLVAGKLFGISTF